MVAYTGHHSACYYWRFNHHGKFFGACSFYIYFILMKKDTRYTHLQTILVLVLFLGVLYWFTRQPYLLAAAGLLGLAGLFFPAIAAFIHKAWMGLAHVLGAVSGTIFLSIIFFLIITPLGWLYRKSLKPGFRSKGNGGTFVARNHLFVKKDLENIW